MEKAELSHAPRFTYSSVAGNTKVIRVSVELRARLRRTSAVWTLAFTACVASVARAEEPEQPPSNSQIPADTGAEDAEKPHRMHDGYTLEAELDSTYSSNLYHEQRRRQDSFGQNAPGQRYFGMEGPEDLVNEARVEGSHKWDLGEHRDAKAALGAGYVFHLQNAIANYFELGAAFGYDVARRDRLSLDVEFVPRRFKKNYAADQIAGSSVYEHAYYREIVVTPAYRHGFTKQLRADLAYELGVKEFEDPFKNRDTISHGVELVVRNEFGRVTPGLGGGAAIGTTPSGIEFGIPVERSYRDVVLLGLVDVDLPSGFDVGLDVEYRIRHYTTDEPRNDTYFDRTDRRWELGLELTKRFGRHFAVLGNLGFVVNETNRQDHPNVAPEDLGYEELLAGLGCKAAL